MRGLFYFSLGALFALVVAVPALTGKGKGAAKGKDKPKPAAAHTERGASGASARATASRGTDRAAEGLLKQGDRLIWGVSEDRFQETVTFTSLAGESLLLAVFDSQDPDRFKVPIGINTHRVLDRDGSYKVKVEVGAQGNATPSRFSFTIKKHDETIEIGRITQLDGD